jgi:hypothetical protein
MKDVKGLTAAPSVVPAGGTAVTSLLWFVRLLARVSAFGPNRRC